MLSMSILQFSKRFLNELVVHNHLSYKIKKMYMRKAKALMHRLISNSLFPVLLLSFQTLLIALISNSISLKILISI